MTTSPESIKQLLHSENFGDRIKGINDLRNIEPAIAYELIKPLSQDENVRVRYAVISQHATFGELNKEELLEIIKDRLYNDPESDVRAAAADSIGGLKLTLAFPDLKKVYHDNPDWLVQFSIIAALGELGHEEGFDLLQEALTSDNVLLQTTAISALGELGNKNAIDLLIPFADNTDWQVRHRLAQALGKLGGEKVEPVLAKLAEDESNIVAEEAKYHLN